jgi:hypothetical protein
MMADVAAVAQDEQQQQPPPAAAAAAPEEIDSDHSSNNRLAGPGILIRTIEKGDGVTHPQTGDSCVVSDVMYVSFFILLTLTM